MQSTAAALNSATKPAPCADMPPVIADKTLTAAQVACEVPPKAAPAKQCEPPEVNPPLPPVASSVPIDAPLTMRLETIASQANLTDALTALTHWVRLQHSSEVLDLFFGTKALENIMSTLFTTPQDADITGAVTTFLQLLLDLSEDQTFSLLTSLQFVLRTSNQWDHIHGKVKHDGTAALVQRVSACIRSLYTSIQHQRSVEESRKDLTSLANNVDTISQSISSLAAQGDSSIRALLEIRELTTERLSLQLKV